MAQVKLTIELMSDGSISVNGPINNTLLCYGLLESAKDAIRDHVKRVQEAKQIAVPMLSIAGRA